MTDTPIFYETQAALDIRALAHYRLPDIRGERRQAAERLQVEVPSGYAGRGWLVLAGVFIALAVFAVLVVTL